MVEEAPGFSEVAELVQNYLASSDVALAFNIRLDWRMLGYQFQDVGLERLLYPQFYSKHPILNVYAGMNLRP